jgi:hypothetical protein
MLRNELEAEAEMAEAIASALVGLSQTGTGKLAKYFN